jgi:GrpB-like predicted nucleotidyltransferase (UPF0157 family)/GNAT superfamily N-acetyltransferase
MPLFLETKRLVLKKPKLSDVDDLLLLRSDSEVMKYIGRDGLIQTKEEVERFLNMAIPYQEENGFGFCSVFEKGSGAFVGQAGLFHLGFDEAQSEIEIAYRLLPKFWGKGYGTELVRALIQWGFDHLAVDKLIAIVHPENNRSRHILDKVGMMHTGEAEYFGKKVQRYETFKNDSIELTEYNSEWPKMAALEIKMLREILPEEHIVDIQHVGSTAIPGMLSKPIIDSINALKTQGYAYWEENPDPTRLFFVKGMPPYGEKRTHHVHIVERHSQHWRDKITFRDYLIAHPESAHEYANLKIRLAKQYTYDREQYTEAKKEFINKILLLKK